MSRHSWFTLAAALLVSGPPADVASAQATRASQVKVTILSTMLVGNGYVPGHADYAMSLLRADAGVRSLFERRL